MSNKKNIAIIAGKFHQKLVDKMLIKAKAVANQSNLNIYKEIWIPGCFDLPLVLKQVLKNREIDGIVLLGIIEKGATKHGLVMAQAVFSAIIQLELEYEKPIGKGIIGPDVKPKQIEERLILHATNAVKAVADYFS